jgi:hypothetical protein
LIKLDFFQSTTFKRDLEFPVFSRSDKILATRTSIQGLNRTTALLGKVLLCLALLLSFSIATVEDLTWSATDMVMDEQRGSSVPMVAKINYNSKLPNSAKEKLNPEPCCQLDHYVPLPPQSSPAQTAWHRRAPPSFNFLDCNAPFPPRAPTA